MLPDIFGLRRRKERREQLETMLKGVPGAIILLSEGTKIVETILKKSGEIYTFSKTLPNSTTPRGRSFRLSASEIKNAYNVHGDGQVLPEQSPGESIESRIHLHYTSRLGAIEIRGSSSYIGVLADGQNAGDHAFRFGDRIWDQDVVPLVINCLVPAELVEAVYDGRGNLISPKLVALSSKEMEKYVKVE